jgi:Fe-S cluster assembly protein SufD
VYVKVGRDSSVKHNSITLYNGQTRNLCDVYLEGENSEVTLNGCAIADGSQRIDNNTLIDHKVPNCSSNELYKYVVDGNSVGAFAGKILVEKDAQKTASQETNANLCASADARMFTQPMLEIYADDVKCAHGSTVGVMDETALFYMRQRGIPEDVARMLLKNAFMGQVIDQIRLQPLRDKLFVKVEKRFRGELDKCEDCRLCK